MAEFFGKGISVGSGFDLGANLPLDNRTVQATLADRDTMPTIQLVEGLFVYVKENKTAYILKGFNADGTNRVWETVATGTVVEIINSLESDRTDAALSAAQGKALKTLVEELRSSVSAALDYKGSKDTYELLPTTGNKKGDVWNVVAAHGNTPAGTNYAWEGTKWDPLGGTVDLSGYYTKSQVDDAIAAEAALRVAADNALDGKITTNANAIANKVDKQDGFSLISDSDRTQIDTNKTDIATLKNELSGSGTGIGKDVEDLKTAVGDTASGLVKDVDDLQTAVNNIQTNDKVQDVDTTASSGVSLSLDPATKKVKASVAVGTLATDLVASPNLAGTTIKVGEAITDGANIAATDTVSQGLQKLGAAIKTAQAGGITSISSPDSSIEITGSGNVRNLSVNVANIIAANSAIQEDADGNLDLFWTEVN